MNMSKLNPSNWFRHEENEESSMPVAKSGQQVRPRAALHHEIDRLFDDFFRRPFSALAFPGAGQVFSQGDFFKPSLDLKASDKEYLLSVELPGVDEKDISIELTQGALVISGEKKQESEDKDEKQGVYRMERSYGSFRRTLDLPEDADAENIKASFKKGVLDIKIPRAQSKENKKIPIN